MIIILLGIILGMALAAILTLASGVYSIGPTERAVLTTWGRVQRTQGFTADDPALGALLTGDERERYNYPNIQVIPPGGPYFKWPWQKLYRVDMTIQTTDIAWDPDIKQDAIEAVTRDNLTVKFTGQIRWKRCERNLYANIFAVRAPAAHVVGYFVSVLRDRVATFRSEHSEGVVDQVSINDLRKNLSQINAYMEEACRKTAARYGVELDAALVTSIDAPAEVEEALASINTTQNQVAASISQARADADRKIKAAEQAVQIASNQAAAEAAPVKALGDILRTLFAQGGPAALQGYLRNARLPLREKAAQTIFPA